jgi:hypothetical protein
MRFARSKVSVSRPIILFMGGHTLDELRAFFDVDLDARNVWARDVRLIGDTVIGSVVYMPERAADRFKPDTREGHLVCLVPDCPTPLLTARGGATGRRHHWAHRSAPNPRHEPESLWHLNSKAALATWASARYPAAVVHLDDRRTAHRNRPDVWVRMPWAAGRDGQVKPGWGIAFEAQKSAIDVRELDRRNGRYIQDGIIAVWFFQVIDGVELAGRAADHPDDRGPLQLRPMHRNVAERTGRLRWFNPSTRQIATAVVVERYRPEPLEGEHWWSVPGQVSRWRHPCAGDTHAYVRIDSLDDCTLGSDGLRSPADDWVEQQAAATAAEENQLRAKAREAYATAQRIAGERADRARQGNRLSGEPDTRYSQRFASVETQADVCEQRRNWVPSPPRWTPAARPTPPPPDRLAEPCPYCRGVVEARSEWPSWFVPPKGATRVAVCTGCETPFAVPAG